jgi:ribosomal protein S10
LPYFIIITVNRQQFDYRALGLKHDPTQLPLKRNLDPWDEAFTEEEYAMTLVHGRSVHEPFLHARTHDIPVANIHFRSHHIELLRLFTHFALHAASSLGIPTSGVASLPTKRTLWTVPRSPFVHKKSQENFERRVHKRAIKAWDADAEVVQRWIAYLRTHALAGVGMKVTTWDRVPIGIGNAKILYRHEDEATPRLIAPKEIKQLGEKIERATAI